ncbi:HesB/IscA family protein [Aquidulcibacter sp.]|jgi:iron-sulfur cluster assembly protein|uniref:HesB/IscA family protein n=1 Tax=Aquidulcibacter sp. TaxID=2052990 RepID=UPI0022BDA37F|nr:iron-sulfur cluster assembly accessory protein [Aquidulcibacter sp.]MCE2890154.1 iron-sulfur cluster assembly accessory protein [Hyphomonadaceae bacterium]MCZ8208283.1 iron-sulfur cluster assembly accessory protein [Aquidulcibacter sp.]
MNSPDLIPTRTRRPRPQVVSLTDAAAERVRDVMAKSEKPYLRVGIKNGGCAGMEYVMAYADAPDPLDEVVEDKGVKILVASNAILFLVGSVVDVENTKLHSKFVFKNPNETDACGCGESVTIVPATSEA